MNLKVLQLIDKELESAKTRYPWWPSDAVHAGAIVAEEAGELTQATLDHVYDHLNHNGKDTMARMRKEAVQTAAMAIRFLENMESYGDPGRRMKADPISHSEMVDYIRGNAWCVDGTDTGQFNPATAKIMDNYRHDDGESDDLGTRAEVIE